jgi:hypothetical protein
VSEPSQTYGASYSANFNVCHHGKAIEVGSTERCEPCDDERWQDWFTHFEDRYETYHGHRYPIHGYTEDDLREAYEHRF